MRVFLGMILGALLLVAGVYIYDSMSTSTVANGEVAQANRTIVNWDVAATDWNALKLRAHERLDQDVVEIATSHSSASSDEGAAISSPPPFAHRQWPDRTPPWSARRARGTCRR